VAEDPAAEAVSVSTAFAEEASDKLTLSNLRWRYAMTIMQIGVQRFSVTSSNPFEDVLQRIEQAIGHPDMSAFRKDIAAASNYAEMEKAVNQSIGSSGLMEFARFDLGEVIRKSRGVSVPKSLRLVVGNPLIMKEMVERVPDAGSYAPVTILIDEREDGVHLSYDRMASYLRSYDNREALRVARELDSKVEALLTAAV
jgi:uncharacterized protein (DUF302 family)